jgi:hypothetical protein
MSLQSLKYLTPVLICLALAGCPGTSVQDTPTGDTGGVGENTTPAGDTGTGPDNSNGTVDNQTGGDGNTPADGGVDNNAGQTPTGALGLHGRINPGQAAKRRPRVQGSELYPFTVVAQSDTTGEIYRGETDADGAFQVDIPEDETGSSFMVTVLGPDGRAVGPVVLDSSGGEGVTGLALDRPADLGTIDLPADPTTAPIAPGSDGDVAELIDPSITARLNADGAPIGLASVGKGADADSAENRAGGAVDADGDGLIDMLDADDDGDGVVDDFDTAAPAPGAPADTHVNFFMNLKIGSEFAQTYYTGTADEIATRLSTDTIITLEVMMEPVATRAISSARMLETPGPAYLPLASKTGAGNPGALWANTAYAFDLLGDRWGVWIVPNAVMDAGDTFTLEVNYDDGTMVQYSRMINYVFKNIPKLVQYGAPGSLVAFELHGGAVNGSPSNPIPFDGTQDLVLVFSPPPDDTGAPITGMNYTFQIAYNGATLGQLNQNINYTASWPTPIPNFDRGTYLIRSADLGELSADGTYTATLPSAVFADTVTLNDASTEAVASYKMDLTAEAPTGNAAIMLTYVKQ